MDIIEFAAQNMRDAFGKRLLDVRNSKGEQVALITGMWYVGMNWLESIEDTGAGEIAQYIGDGQFYDEGAEEPTRMQDYEYLLESHMGRL